MIGMFLIVLEEMQNTKEAETKKTLLEKISMQ